MSVEVFSEEELSGCLHGGWSVPGLRAGLFQIAVTGPGLQLILGLPERGSADPIELLALDAEEEEAVVALGRALPDLRGAVEQRGAAGHGIRPHGDRERITASPEMAARILRILAADLAWPKDGSV